MRCLLEQIPALHRLKVDPKAFRPDPLEDPEDRRSAPSYAWSICRMQLHGHTQCAERFPRSPAGAAASGFSWITDSGFLRSWDTTAITSSRARTARCSLKSAARGPLRGAPLQLVRGLEIARRPWTRAGAHLLFPRANEWRGRRRSPASADRLGWIAAPIHRLDDLRAEPHQPSAGQREREQPTGDVARCERRREGGPPVKRWRTA